MTQTHRRDTYGVYRIDAERSTAVSVSVWDEGAARGIAHQASLHDHGARFVVSRFIGGTGQGVPVVAYVAGDTRDPSIGAMPATEPTTPDLGMFTPEGNAIVAKVVDSLASRSGRTIACVVTALDVVADLFPQHKEAGDTEVRERVVAALAERDFIIRD